MLSYEMNVALDEQTKNAENYNDEKIEEESSLDEVSTENRLTGYDIAVFYNTYNLSTLLKWWDDGKLVVPDFQRAYVWTKKEASEFVDSMLRGLPVPSMFFYDDTDYNRMLVVDGQQRLKSLYDFIKNEKFQGEEFRLVGNIHPDWKNKKFVELKKEEQDRLEDALMNITVMRQLAPDDGHSAMYLAFQRINTGGISLKAQEIRMAVSYGELARKLSKLAMDPRFEKCDYFRTTSQKKNKNYSPIEELILKFWTYYFSYPNYYGSSTRVMLDDFFDTQKDLDNPKKKKQGKTYRSWEELEEAFSAAFDEVISLSKDDLSPFGRPSQTFLEAIWVGLTYRRLKSEKEIDVGNLSSHIAKWRDSIGEELFSELFQARRTSSTKSAFERIKAGVEYFSGDF